jgi:hypothetical protein
LDFLHIILRFRIVGRVTTNNWGDAVNQTLTIGNENNRNKRE